MCSEMMNFLPKGTGSPTLVFIVPPSLFTSPDLELMRLEWNTLGSRHS